MRQYRTEKKLQITEMQIKLTRLHQCRQLQENWLLFIRIAQLWFTDHAGRTANLNFVN